MPILHAIVLGLVQGLSEFLPISSSGHLLLVPWLFGWDDFDSAGVEKAFDVALHLGTLVAAILYFRKDLAVYVREGFRLVIHRDRPATPEGRLAWLLAAVDGAGGAGGCVVRVVDRREARHAGDHRHLAHRVRSVAGDGPIGRPGNARSRDTVSATR